MRLPTIALILVTSIWMSLTRKRAAMAFVLPAVTYTTASTRGFAPLFAESPETQAWEELLWTRSETPMTTEIVYILLYNPGTAEEAVHTATLEREASTEILWAFTDPMDAFAYAEILKRHERPPRFNMALSPEPVPTPTPLSQMRQAASDMGLTLRIVPGTDEE